MKNKTTRKHELGSQLNQTIKKQLRRAEVGQEERRARRAELRKWTGIQTVGGAQ